MATTPAEKVMAGDGDNSVFVVINFNVNIIIYLKIQLESAIIDDGGIAVKFQLLPSSSELGKSDKLSSDKKLSTPAAGRLARILLI